MKDLVRKLNDQFKESIKMSQHPIILEAQCKCLLYDTAKALLSQGLIDETECLTFRIEVENLYL